MSYPVTFEADYAERHSRLTSFFRLILVIPVAIVLYIYGILAVIAIVIAWFAIVITGRYPRGLYEFVAGFNRAQARITAYAALVCDPYPPFWGSPDPSYPVRMQFAGPLPHYSRLKTFFRFLLAIPILILRYVMGLLLEVGAVAAWVVIVITGKLPRGLFDVLVLANSYTARSDAYLYLLTETYPPFQDTQTRTAGAPGPPIAERPSAEPPGTAPPGTAPPAPPIPEPPAAGPPIPEPPAAGHPPSEPPPGS
jgi:Domain of unknown function (DUF4389)